MKKLIIFGVVISSLTACSQVAQTYVDTTDKMGLTPKYAQQINQAITEDKLDNSLKNMPHQYPVFPAPKGVANGEYQKKGKQGRTIKSYVINGKFDKYIDIYYPNGQLHSHTPLVNGLAEGWSIGYVADGRVRTKFLYKKGKMVRFQGYDPQENLIYDKKIHE